MRIVLIPTWLQEFEKEAGYMTKQEKIRKGIEIILESAGANKGWSLNILAYLDSEGGVLKVERELPENPYDISLEYEYEYHEGVENYKGLLAGYEATESLI